MSDFLSNLLARAAGNAETVRPRLPALFEPLGSSLKPAAAPLVRASHDAGVNREETQPRRQNDPARAVPRFQPQPAPVSPTDVSDDTTPPIARRKISQPPDQPEYPASVHIEEKDSTPPATPRVSRPVEQSASPQPIALNFAGPAPQPDAVRAQAISAASPPFKAPVETVVPPERAGAFRPSRAAVVSPPNEQPRQTLVPRQIAPAAIRRPAPSEIPRSQGAVPQAEPVIHVTIGRIEVRATTPERPSRQERRPSPVVGLEQYLQGRAKAGSR